MEHEHSPLPGIRYDVIEQIGMGGMGVVYRVFDRLTGEEIALKRVHVSPELFTLTLHNGGQDPRLGLAREFRTISSLRHPNIVKVLEYGFDTDRQPYYTMELFQKSENLLEYGQEKSIQEKVALLVQVLQALAYLHRRGIIHRDLKPDNALVVNHQIKILDFGVAITHDYQPIGEEAISGTLAYMAPEVLTGEQATKQSDLYSVGVMAYELLLGSYPFPARSIPTLIDSILYTSLDPLALDLDEKLAAVVVRLLEKHPHQRYASAEDTIRELCQAVGEPIPAETTAIRNSFLQAAELIGRETEMNQLQSALKQALAGEGNAWLISGESGVGKSRLMDELQIHALVNGAIVLRSQGTAELGLTYQFWREPVRRLLLSSELSDTEAAVLKEIVPDIDILLRRVIPDLPELHGRSGQQRLISVITSLFQRQRQPIVLLLDDLQWAVESLEVLRILGNHVSNLPLLIVGTYRDDESPDLPRQLPDMRIIHLKRLSPEEISRLSVSMLGQAGERQPVIELLERETEGNVFFVIEVIRALAEEVGRMSDIGLKTLPAKVFTGGISQIVSNRLSKVPPSAQPLLRLAATAGRQLDLKVMHKLAETVDLDQWLMICANTAILEVVNSEWRFTHDKLREGILADFNSGELKHLHRQIALALEVVYPEAREQWGLLARHWRLAEDETRERHYAVLAGGQRLRVGDYREAMTLLQRAMQLTPVDDEKQRAYLTIRLGETYQGISEYAEAKHLFEDALSVAQRLDNQQLAADALQHLGLLAVIQGDYVAAIQLFTSCLTAADKGDDSLLRIFTLGYLGEVFTNAGQFDQAGQYIRDGLNMARELNDPYALSFMLRMDSKYKFTIGDLEGDRLSAVESMQLAQQIGDRYTVARILNGMGVASATIGNYSEARTHYLEAMRIFREIGDRWGMAFILNNLGFVDLLSGDYPGAARYFYQALADSIVIGVIPVILESLVGLARVFLEIDKVKEAPLLLGLALNHPSTFTDVHVLAEPALERLKTLLSPDVLQSGLEQGKQSDLHGFIARLLAEHASTRGTPK